MSSSPTPRFTASLERSGADELRRIAALREQLLGATHGLERFSVRMALVESTGSVAGWARTAHDALRDAGRADAATPFALPPPFAATDATAADCDRLSDYVEARIRLLHELRSDDRST